LIEQGVYPPILPENMEFTQERAKINFFEKYQLGKAPTAQKAFGELRKYYSLDESLSDEEARKILVVRYNLTELGYYRYLPVRVAGGLTKEAVVEIEEKLQDMPGVTTSTESVRYYPQGRRASHVIGYLGRISSENEEEYIVEKGYKPSAFVGLDGIELIKEGVLHGKDGVKKIQVNSYGEVMYTFNDATEPEAGKDIVLTLDIRLQEVAEDALAQNIQNLSSGVGTYNSKFGSYSYYSAYPAPNCRSGAVVAIDIKTGEPLAIASYPDFDPNDFAQGISDEKWATLQAENPRDPLSPRPLYNIATLTAVQPGSTFKPITGVTALESGLDPNRMLYDGGKIEYADHIYSCMAWTVGGGTHGSVNLYSALEVSCNYYFFDVASGRDWNENKLDLGYAANISIDKITDYARQFGLGLPTGIELPETVASPATSQTKLENTEALLSLYLYSQAEYLFKDSFLQDEEALDKSIETIVSWTKENPSLEDIASRMKTLGIKDEEIDALAENCKYTYYNFAEWTEGDTFNIAIGQGENAFTPLQMANYIATLGNGGTRNSLSLIKAVEGQGAVPRSSGVPVDVSNPQYLRDVLEGMRLAVAGSRGTLTRGLSGLPISVAGKTGTAERDGYINPPDEVAYVQAHLSSINPALTWEQVQAEMQRLMKEYPEEYSNPNTAVRKAVVNLSGRGFDTERIDIYKGKYDNFAWVVGLAPAEDPQIAVVCLLVQGTESLNAEPVVRDVILQYFENQAADAQIEKSIDYRTFFTQDNRANTSFEAAVAAWQNSGNEANG
jgi:penicillin-binding protein 2